MAYRLDGATCKTTLDSLVAAIVDSCAASVAERLGAGDDRELAVAHARDPTQLARDDTPRLADIVVGAVGKPEFIKGSWIKQGAVVIDAGYQFFG